ncbi:MAG: hypothetical protein PHQ23_11665, partial [Candidatus Wallbacteria bacterium]|nr:hypothetical protein [Candidatus Wallbacteria bacterium]
GLSGYGIDGIAWATMLTCIIFSTLLIFSAAGISDLKTKHVTGVLLPLNAIGLFGTAASFHHQGWMIVLPLLVWGVYQRRRIRRIVRIGLKQYGTT